MGLVNELGDFTANIIESAECLRPLISPQRSFVWTADHDDSFENVKKALFQNHPVLTQVDPAPMTIWDMSYNKKTVKDIGPLSSDSRFLGEVESRYKTIELEIVAVVWAMTSSDFIF